MNFHKKYKRITPWWRCFTAEYKMIAMHSEMTGVTGFEYEDYVIKLTRDGRLTVMPDFMFGASGPTLDRFFGFFKKKMRKIRRGVCFHDAGYYLSQMGVFKGPHSKLIKQKFDNMFGDMMIADGVWSIRSDIWESSVEKFGKSSWESKK